jgi:hypothetical integral membrane protein (TIGR02206 family)
MQTVLGVFPMILALARGQRYWEHHFKPFTLVHLGVILAFVVFLISIVALRRCDDIALVSPRRRLVDKTIGWLALAAACFVQISTLWPSRFDYRTALPLHICDFVMFIAPLALILKYRPLRAIAYFWGLGLSSLAFIYPDLQYGPADFQFWVFWAGHLAILGPALYDVTARGFRPHAHDYRFAVIFSTIYLAIIFPIDARFHLNYGYVGRTFKGQRSPFDYLGPWPWRVPVMYVLAMLMMFLLYIPWAMFHRRSAQEAKCDTDSSQQNNSTAAAH